MTLPTLPRITAQFVAQHWVDDQALTDWTDTFDLTDAVLTMGRARALLLRDNRDNTDSVIPSGLRDEWMKSASPHFEPTCIAMGVEDAVTDYFRALDAWAARENITPAEAFARAKAAREAAQDEAVELESALYALADEHDQFLHGDCALMAVALQQRLGGEIQGMLNEDRCLIHALVMDTDGQLFDLRGRRSLETVEEEYADETLSDLRAMSAAQIMGLNYDAAHQPSDALRALTDQVADRAAPLIARQRALDGVTPPTAPAPTPKRRR